MSRRESTSKANSKNIIPVALAIIAILGGMVGCGEDESIRIYKVAKSDRQQGLLSQNRSPMSQSMTDMEMLSAVLPKGNSYWVFKLSAKPEVLEDNRDEFRKIVQSVSFEAGEPNWELEDGWKSKKSAGGFTYAEILKESEGVRATVSVLPIDPTESWEDHIVKNVVRWQGQLSLAPTEDWDAIQGNLEELSSLSEGDNTAYFVSLVGKGSGQMRGPFQGGAPSAPSRDSGDDSDSAAMQVTPPEKKKLEYDLPEEWTEQDVSSSAMRLAAFGLEDGDLKAEVTLIPAGGEPTAILGMWFGQIQLDTSEDLLSKTLEEAESIEVNDVDAKLYALGVSDSDSDKSILVVDVPWREGESLFVKLMGDKQLVEKARDDFLKFAKSIKWESDSSN